MKTQKIRQRKFLAQEKVEQFQSKVNYAGDEYNFVATEVVNPSKNTFKIGHY